MTFRQGCVALAVTLIAVMSAGCAPTNNPDELVAHVTIGVIKKPGAKRKTAVLICPGRTSYEANVCAALDVVAPAVFKPVSPQRMCAALYGGPATATVLGTFNDDLVNASFNQTNGCEIGRWKQMVPIFRALKLF